MATDWVDGYLQAWNSHDGRQVAAFMAEDVVYDDLASGLVHRGRDAVQANVEQTVAFSSDYRFVVVSARADGSRYAIEWEMLGTNTGASGGFPATGKPYRIRGASIGERDADGRITANRDYWNVAAYLIEVGLLAVPPPPSA
jgi:steroid delta-isomerase-like uncharacterized protein